MGISKPYYLTVRQFTDGHYSEGGRSRYINRPDYSARPSNYIRAYMLLQKDLLDLFNYIEPSDTALKTYSFRIQELFIRTCIEIEANFKAIFAMNKYSKNLRSLKISDYYLINQSHFLSYYSAKLPYWSENLMTADREPFKDWGNPPDPEKPWILKWYQDYNTTKHDRSNSLHLASLENLIDAFAALVIIISAQYMSEDFSPAPGALLVDSGWNDGYDAAIGDYFRIAYPRHLHESERYDFNWQHLMNKPDAFQQYNYDILAGKK